jgi:hypothetical protein
MDERDME